MFIQFTHVVYIDLSVSFSFCVGGSQQATGVMSTTNWRRCYYQSPSYGITRTFFLKKHTLLNLREHMGLPPSFWLGPCCSSFQFSVFFVLCSFCVFHTMLPMSLDCSFLICSSISNTVYLLTQYRCIPSAHVVIRFILLQLTQVNISILFY